MENETQETTFETIAGVLEYLQTSGWKIAPSSLYRDRGKGKIVPREDGKFLQKDVDKYARTFLKRKSTGKKANDQLDELQRKKLEIELKNLELDQARKKFQHEKDLDKHIPREQLDIELAARAGILDAGLKHWVQSRAAEWIRTVAGDPKKVGELINLMNKDLDEHINNYASTKEFQVIIDLKEEGEEADGDVSGGIAV